MISDRNQKQEGGDNSTNLQGQTVNVYNGISYQDAKLIAQDVFSANFLVLKNEAAQIAKQRAEEITDKFLTTLCEKKPEALGEFNQPSMQDAIFNTQKEYAKSGDKDLGDLLVDILVDRASTPTRNMLQLVLDDALKIAPSLTVQQMDTLTLNFLLNRTQNVTVRDLSRFKDFIDTNICPFVANVLSDLNQYNYLEYQRCGNIRTGSYNPLESNWREIYQGLFGKGVSSEDVKNHIGEESLFPSLIMQSLHDTTLFQISVMNKEILEQQFNKLGVPDELRPKYSQLFESSTMTPTEIKQYLLTVNNCIEKVFQIWHSSMFSRFELTSVGIAIAHANYRRRTGNTLDLSIWIN